MSGCEGVWVAGWGVGGGWRCAYVHMCAQLHACHGQCDTAGVKKGGTNIIVTEVSLLDQAI